MPDETNQPQDGETTGEATNAKQHGEWMTSLPAEAQKYIEELRTENAKWRVEKKRAEDTARKAEEKRLLEQQQWKELADVRGQKLENLEPKQERLIAAFEALIDGRLKRIPPDVRKRMVDPIRANMDSAAFVEWLDANEDMLTLKQAPNLEAGAGQARSTGAGAADLTQDELAMAKKMGISPERMAQEKQKLMRRD
jgi:hypothetical protein